MNIHLAYKIMCYIIYIPNGTYIQTLLLDYTTRVPFPFLILYIGEAPMIERGDGFFLNPAEAKILIGQDSCELGEVSGELQTVRINCVALGDFTRTWWRDGVLLPNTDEALLTNVGPGTYTCVLTSPCGAMDNETTLIYG